MTITVNAMTAAEFKAWLDGFMENRGGRLTQKDIKRIQAQAASVSGGCGCYHPYPYHPWTWTTTPTIFAGTTCAGTVSNQDSTDVTSFTPGVYVNQTPVLPPDTYNVGSPWNPLDTTSMCSG